MSKLPKLAWIIWMAPMAGLQGQPADNPEQIRITRAGQQPSRLVEADHFTGAARLDSMFRGTAPARVSGARVMFPPGARTAWHSHPLGQTRIVTAGTGRVQRWGEPGEEIRQGDVIWIPPGQKHWHGASPANSMTHIAITEQIGGKTVDWMEKVTEEQFRTAVRDQAARPRPSQAAIGDFAPKLAEITDNVLYGDIWERPELSKRDRSLATVAALIAMNRPGQLRSHLQRAWQNGLTPEELMETITHLAFYTGWPNAVGAIAVAKEVFAQK